MVNTFNVKQEAAESPEVDHFADAVMGLIAAIDKLEEQNGRIRVRATELLEERAKGRSWSDIVRDERDTTRGRWAGEADAIIDVLAVKQEVLFDAAGTYRRAKVRALRDDGLTYKEIAKLLNLTRQRVAQLLDG